MPHTVLALPTIVLARVALVIFAFLFVIGIKRRKRLFTVKTSVAQMETALFVQLVTDDLRENRLQLLVFGFFTAVILAYIVYTIYVPAAASL